MRFLKCKSILADKFCRINALKKMKIDFRQLIMLKNKLFDSPQLNTENCLPVNVFNEILDRFESEELKLCLSSVQDSLNVGI